MIETRNKSRSYITALFLFLLVIFGLTYSIGYLQLPWRWWFEDDPVIYTYVSGIENPASIFFQPHFLREFTMGQALVPMQVFSYWADVRMSGFSPQFAYCHQIVSYLLTILSLYLVLNTALQGKRLAAFLICIVWALLPATSVVLQYISTRHYLEGLLFSILTCLLLQRIPQHKRMLQNVLWGGAFICAIIAMLYKEIYLFVAPGILFFFALQYKARKIAFLASLLIIFYFGYRFWVIGPALSYGIPLLGVGQYVKFIFKLPYTIFSGYGSYYVCVFAIALCLYYAFRKKKDFKILLLFGGLIIISLAIIYPVTYPLYRTIRTPFTWYRIIFLIHSISVIFLGYYIAANIPKRFQIGLIIVSGAFLGLGVQKTSDLWIEKTARAEQEGKFYLNNPDKILLSEQEAYWYIPGIHQMYTPDISPHYVLIKDLSDPAFEWDGPVWRFSNGTFTPDSNPRDNMD